MKDKMLKIYIDTCCLQRPLDDQTQPRIRVETEAVFAILAAAQAGELHLLCSSALEYEINRIPDEQRRQEALSILSIASERLTISEATEELAHTLQQQGIGAMDAVHLALASTAEVDFFATCDAPLVRKAQRCDYLSCQCISLLDLLKEVTP
jgi:predicted nucleic acid-binding protein